MNKSKTKKGFAFEILFLIALIAVTFYFLLRDCDIGDIFATIRSANYWYILLGLLMMGLYLFCGGTSVGILFRAMGARMKPLRCLKYHLVEFFFSAITPSSTGGQPIEIMVMRNDGYKATEASAVLLVIAVLFKLAMFVLFFVLYFLNFLFLHAQIVSMWFLFLLGLFLNFFLIVVIMMALYARKTIQRMCLWLVRLLARIRIIKNVERTTTKLNEWLDGFHECAEFMRTHPWPVVKSFLVILLQRVFYLLIPYCVYCSLGLSGVTVWQMMGLQLLLSVSVDMMPLPGAVGISESVFLVLYDAIFGSQYVYSAVMLCRGINYYLVLIVSGLVVIGVRLNDHRTRNRRVAR